MNNIKFRVFNKRANAYENPKDYVLTADGRLMMIFEHESGGRNLIELIDVSDCIGDIYVVETFTGIPDKNGKEIYVGDIVEFENKWEWYAGSFSEWWVMGLKEQELWLDKQPIFTKAVEYDPIHGYDSELSTHYKIVGNIHNVKEKLWRS